MSEFVKDHVVDASVNMHRRRMGRGRAAEGIVTIALDCGFAQSRLVRAHLPQPVEGEEPDDTAPEDLFGDALEGGIKVLCEALQNHLDTGETGEDEDGKMQSHECDAVRTEHPKEINSEHGDMIQLVMEMSKG